jgi:GntR family transcriptional regulator/MocR family aminotransferase
MWPRLDGEGPLTRQVYRALRDAIRSGVFSPGSRVPPTRDLARDLGVSRATVVAAYEQLLAEGHLGARRGSGTYVRPLQAAAREPALPAAPPPPRLAPFARRLADERLRPLLSGLGDRPVLPYDFRYGQASLLDFPVQAWQRCLGRAVRRAPARAYDYGHPQGLVALRRALAAYLGRARGLACDPERILVVRGSQQGLDLAARVLLEPGAAAMVEEPGYEGARNAFLVAGARLVPAPVDGEGLDVAGLDVASVIRLAHATPAHQLPLGAVLSPARRRALLALAESSHGYVIEDDYDGEFRFEGAPLETLAALDGGRRVLHLGTFSKVLFPSLRLAYLVLPEPLVEPLVRAKLVSDGGSPSFEQMALADFIEEGSFERHVRRSRARNRERREALLAALARHLGDDAEVAGAHAGLHLVCWLPRVPAVRLGALWRAAAAEGVGVYPVTPYYHVTPPPRAGLVLGYNAQTPASIDAGIARLAEVARRFAG